MVSDVRMTPVIWRGLDEALHVGAVVPTHHGRSMVRVHDDGTEIRTLTTPVWGDEHAVLRYSTLERAIFVRRRRVPDRAQRRLLHAEAVKKIDPHALLMHARASDGWAWLSDTKHGEPVSGIVVGDLAHGPADCQALRVQMVQSRAERFVISTSPMGVPYRQRIHPPPVEVSI